MAYCALYSYSSVTQIFFLQCKNCDLCSVSSSDILPPCLSQISAHKVTFPNTPFMATQSTSTNPVTLFISSICNSRLGAICYFPFRLISLCCPILFLFSPPTSAPCPTPPLELPAPLSSFHHSSGLLCSIHCSSLCA